MSNTNNSSYSNSTNSTDDNTSQNNQIIITKETVRRLASDIKMLIEDPLDNHNIYYEHDQSDILKGYALIIGPPGTPYENGYYLFEFNFPYDYPFSPPKVVFCISDGYTRFNPNLYVNGKVCLSVLNTWKGEQWTGCQTISSILLSLITIFNETPLEKEPGITKTHKDFYVYNTIIAYKNFEIAIYKLLNNTTNINLESGKFNCFNDIIINKFIENYDDIIANIEIQKKLVDYTPRRNNIISTTIYSMTIKIDYNKLINNMIKLKKKYYYIEK